jgi:sugar lactone lactonase YvrE
LNGKKDHIMSPQTSRFTSPDTCTTADGWSVQRITQPSRLAGANGIRTGADGRIYVAQVAGSQVSAINVDTGEIETIESRGNGIIAPDDLAFDDDGNLFATEITEGRVSVRAPNGVVTVAYGDLPVANPIAFYKGRLFAGELRMGGRIVEIDRSSGAAKVVAADLPMVNAFDVGPDGKLYFPAQAANEIWRVELNGGTPEVVAKDLGIPDSVKFHPDGYIVSTQVASGQVLKIDPRTGAKEVLADIGPGLDNVTFVKGRTFVSHIAGSVHEIVAPGKTRPLVDKGFQWPMGVAVNGAATVYAGDGMFAYAIKPGAERELVGTFVWPGYPGFIRGVAADSNGAWIVSTAIGTIARWIPGQGNEVLASGLEIPMGVALAANGTVVVADAGSGKVLSIQNGTVSELAHGLKVPYGVAIGTDNTVYVSLPEEGKVAKITGGKTATVVDGLSRPEGIAVRGTKLYVVDTVAKSLTECNLASGTRSVIATHVPVGSPAGGAPLRLGGVGDMCGPMWTFTGLAAGADGTVYVAANAEGSVLSFRPV